MKRTPFTRRTPLRAVPDLPRVVRLARTGRLSQRRSKPRPGRVTPWAYGQLREAVYARAAGRCERCGQACPNGVEVHHRKNRSQGGRDALANLLALCSTCHLWATVHPGQSYLAGGWSVPSWADPAHVAVLLPAVTEPPRWVLVGGDGTYYELPTEATE